MQNGPSWSYSVSTHAVLSQVVSDLHIFRQRCSGSSRALNMKRDAVSLEYNTSSLERGHATLTDVQIKLDYWDS